MTTAAARSTALPITWDPACGGMVTIGAINLNEPTHIPLIRAHNTLNSVIPAQAGTQASQRRKRDMPGSTP
jgi:hypothetical protein